LHEQLLESDDQHSERERSDKKRKETETKILPKLFKLKLSSIERRARRNYAQLADDRPDFMTVSMDELDSDQQGIVGWASVTEASLGGRSSLNASPDGSPLSSRGGSPLPGMSKGRFLFRLSLSSLSFVSLSLSSLFRLSLSSLSFVSLSRSL
jgi:hypothetical protein